MKVVAGIIFLITIISAISTTIAAFEAANTFVPFISALVTVGLVMAFFVTITEF